MAARRGEERLKRERERERERRFLVFRLPTCISTLARPRGGGAFRIPHPLRSSFFFFLYQKHTRMQTKTSGGQALHRRDSGRDHGGTARRLRFRLWRPLRRRFHGRARVWLRHLCRPESRACISGGERRRGDREARAWWGQTRERRGKLSPSVEHSTEGLFARALLA